MSHQHAGVVKRQLWELPTATSASYAKHCTPFTLPSNGVLSLADSVITLTTNVVFVPECTGGAQDISGMPQDVSSIADWKEPFYASTIPQTFVIAAATVIAWILVIMLIITPRTSFLGHSGSAPGFSSGHGLIGGATGGRTNLIGVGSRPWLQKVAALTVAISLTIATADTFVEAESQYNSGYMDATLLRDKVLGSLEIRISRVISDVFLWLAQVQTLIRLFPRHKEKVLIKWIGFALMLLDSLFSCLNSFYTPENQHNPRQHQPRQFVDAIPALSYLFQLALGMLYAAWVMYYSLTKRRYAFYHNQMRSICLIALLSLVAVLTPVVFFVTDVSNPDVAGWGDYFRWVGAAAASVVVWEWVERIEALERDEKKDGILGREIFDGDEMLEVTPSDEVVWNNKRGRVRKGDGRDGEDGGNASSAVEKGFGGVARRLRNRHYKPRQHFPLGRAHSNNTATNESTQPSTGPNAIAFGNLPKPRGQRRVALLGGPTPPPPVVSPVDRADTTSAASTVYVVHYHPVTEVAQPVRRRVDASDNTAETVNQQHEQQQQSAQAHGGARDPEKEAVEEEAQPNRERRPNNWFSVANPFKRKRASPPAEVQQARRGTLDEERTAQAVIRAVTPSHNFSRWDLVNRAGLLAAQAGERWQERSARRRPQQDFPVTIIPAQPRGSGRTWSPQQTQEQSTSKAESSGTTDSSPNTTLTANSDPDPTSLHQIPESEDADAIESAPAATTPSPPRDRVSQPPRASELSPSPVAGGTTVVPAPRRSVRSSPLATNSTSAANAVESTTPPQDSSRDNG